MAKSKARNLLSGYLRIGRSRPKKFTPEQISLALSLLEQGKTYRQITTMTGIGKSTLIRAKKQGA